MNSYVEWYRDDSGRFTGSGAVTCSRRGRGHAIRFPGYDGEPHINDRVAGIPGDWTVGPDGCSNSSEEYRYLKAEIERLIKGSAHDLIAGRADRTAGLILAQLAHKHGMRPSDTAEPRVDIG